MDYSSVTVRGHLVTAPIDRQLGDRIACAQTSRRLLDPQVDPRDPETYTLLTSVLDREIHEARQHLGELLNRDELPKLLKDSLLHELAHEQVNPAQRLSSVQAGRISERLLRESSLEPCHSLPPGPVRIPEDTWKEFRRDLLNRPLLDAFEVKLAPYVSAAFPVEGFYRRLFSLRGNPASAPLTGLTVTVKAPASAILYRLSFGALPWPELVRRITEHDAGLHADQLHETFRFLEEAGLVEVVAPLPDAAGMAGRLAAIDHPRAREWTARFGALLDQRPTPRVPDRGPPRLPLPRLQPLLRARLRRLRWRRSVATFLQREGLLVPLFRSVQAVLNLQRHPARMTLHDFIRGLRLLGAAGYDSRDFADRCIAFDQEVWSDTEIHAADLPLDGPPDDGSNGHSTPPATRWSDEFPGSRLRTQWCANGEEGWRLEDSVLRWEYGHRVLSLAQETVWEETEQGRRLPIRWMPWILEYLWLRHTDQVVRLHEVDQDGIVLRPQTMLIPAGCAELRLLSPPDPERTDSLNVLRFGSKLHQMMSLDDTLRFEALPPAPDLTAEVCMVDLRNPWAIRLLLRWMADHRGQPLRVTRACTGQVFFME